MKKPNQHMSKKPEERLMTEEEIWEQISSPSSRFVRGSFWVTEEEGDPELNIRKLISFLHKHLKPKK